MKTTAATLTAHGLTLNASQAVGVIYNPPTAERGACVSLSTTEHGHAASIYTPTKGEAPTVNTYNAHNAHTSASITTITSPRGAVLATVHS